MGITHNWNGTVLTITSDSGTSSADLKGATGDDGCRGPKGADGFVKFESLTTEQRASLKGDKWEKIYEYTVPEGSEESNAFNIDQDSEGQPFELIKCRLCFKFPKYTGETSIPANSYITLNGSQTEEGIAPYPAAGRGVISKVKAVSPTGFVYEVDVSGIQMIEKVLRAPAGGWNNDTDKTYTTYGSTSSVFSQYYSDSLWAKPITAVGGTSMLIYPGCHYVLYGVRALEGD